MEMLLVAADADAAGNKMLWQRVFEYSDLEKGVQKSPAPVSKANL